MDLCLIVGMFSCKNKFLELTLLVYRNAPLQCDTSISELLTGT